MPNIGKVVIRGTNRSTIVSQNFSPKPNVALVELNDVVTAGQQDGFALTYNSVTGKYELQEVVANTVLQVVGGTF